MTDASTYWSDNSNRILGAYFAFAGIASFWVYRGALNGDFFSDDSFYVIQIAQNYLLDWDLVVNAMDPTSDLKFEIMNYAPLYLLTSRIEYAFFGESTFGYHVVNVVFHAVNATLLVAVSLRAGIDKSWALIGGTFFVMHPANVEVVSWISQLRSILALGCAMGSLLALRRHPGIAAGLFAAGLLFKVSALFALPIAFVLAWSAAKDSSQVPISFRWLGVWVALFALFSYPEFAAFDATGHAAVPQFADASEKMRSMAAIGTRYLVMAVTSIGLSAYHTPEPVRSWLDPWWLVSLPIGSVLLWRIARTLARGQAEAAHWLGAAAAFGPISQIFPFYFGMGDRYLYFILPGLIIATLLWWREVEDTILPRIPGLRIHFRGLTVLDWGLRAALVVIIALFAQRSMQRARYWEKGENLMLDAALHYPDGGAASWVRSMRAFASGDINEGLHEFQGVIDTGYYRYASIFEVPQLMHLHQHPRFIALRKQLAQLVLDDFEVRAPVTQFEIRNAGTAQFYLEDYDAALATFEAALRKGGPHRDALINDLAVVREARRRARSVKSR